MHQGGCGTQKNNGLSFKSIFDSEDILTIGDIAVDWKTKTIWIGTGEVNSSRSSYAGIGVYKSSDGGNTWAPTGQLSANAFTGFRLVQDPDESNTLLAATNAGIYRTAITLNISRSNK